MKLTEWLQSKGQNDSATFVIAKAARWEGAPGHTFEYKTTPIRTVWEWLEGNTGEKYIVINANHPPIDVTGNWVRWYEKGRVLCAMITTEEDVRTIYSEKQAEDMLDMWDREVRK